jgi:hypothetical protein
MCDWVSEEAYFILCWVNCYHGRCGSGKRAGAGVSTPNVSDTGAGVTVTPRDESHARHCCTWQQTYSTAKFAASWRWCRTFFNNVVLCLLHCPKSLNSFRFENLAYFRLQMNRTQKGSYICFDLGSATVNPWFQCPKDWILFLIPSTWSGK